MGIWILSFFTGILVIVTLYFALKLPNPKVKFGAVIALILILIGETFDLLAEIVLDQLLVLFAETVEFFAVLGFFVMIYYICAKSEEIKKKSKRKKKR